MAKTQSQNSAIYSRLLIGKARHLLLRARQKELSPFQISPRQANVLAIIYQLGEDANLAHLAECSNRNTNTLSIQMKRMEADGLVTKVRTNPKSNQLRFELTAKGFDAYKNGQKMKSVKEIMTVLTEAERQQLITLLEKVIKKAEKYQ
jgi:DNA-binding MarR family transcriptional regulator